LMLDDLLTDEIESDWDEDEDEEGEGDYLAEDEDKP